MNLTEARTHIKELASQRLDGPVTVEILEWEDGDFSIRAHHTIDATLDYEKVTGENSAGHPFYREVVVHESSNGSTRHEVNRHYSEQTTFVNVWNTELE